MARISRVTETAFTLRPADPAEDFGPIAHLLTLVEPEPVTPEMVQEWENRDFAGQIRRRMVAVSPTGEIVGYSVALHSPWMAEGRFYTWVTSHPEWRRQGIGRQLYAETLRFVRQQGGSYLDSEVRDGDPADLAFAERRGFTIHHHMFESTLELASFDETPFAGLVEQVQAGGIRFFSLAEADTPEIRRQLYEVNRRNSLDDPGSNGVFPGWEEFERIVFAADWFRPGGQILAADGDRIIGLGAVGYFEKTNSMYNMMTGVDRAYRGRKIAQALKLQTIRFARRSGAACIRTTNESYNEPMLAINRKLGYRPKPGTFRLVKDFSTG
jgi:GNAT superfamily N-acetyltransferase